MPSPLRRRSDLAPLLALLAMTAAWGSTFFLIKDLLVRLPVADMLALRFGIGSLALVLLAGRRLRMSRATLRSGLLLGLLYGVAQILQTAGLALTSASVSGFITGLYVVATPLLAALLLRTRVSATTWAASGLATVGLGVLSLNGFALGPGELLTLLSALVYAGHIIAMGRLSTPGEALPLSLVQMVVITAVCTVAAVWPGAGSPGLQLPASTGDWLAVLYLAVVAGALTMVLQTWAQARVEAARAAVVMAMEPVWAAAFAVTLGDDRLTSRMVAGGLAILAAMYLVELAPRRRRGRADAGPTGPATPVDVGRETS
ncbi:Threonine/homoserine efflux transporter RhtA [Friedmanniella luteola]|uniref:Threonine/homoserine efflux transporter RhtA n=1 Tax=Friedmanniella luteola TaxID=546871 RepID=A0A1H1PA34_9ACTN|nr:DMT family transporter [Friedmanniella luteola]SDS07489.1 Threonine/homoserine efflux transporter RhtA [Friedmanniella luteola]